MTPPTKTSSRKESTHESILRVATDLLREQGIESVKVLGAEQPVETKASETPPKRGRRGKVPAAARAMADRTGMPPAMEAGAKKPLPTAVTREERTLIAFPVGQ